MPSTKAAGGGIYSGVFDKDVKVPDQSRSQGGARWYLFFQHIPARHSLCSVEVTFSGTSSFQIKRMTVSEFIRL